MPSYTQEQIEQAKKEAQLLIDIYGSAHGQIFFCTDYAAKLEKAGDFMRRACPMIVARDNWDAARKEKP
jgi:hypothetical protein